MPLGRTNRKRSVVAPAALAAGAALGLVMGAGEARADGPVTGTGKGIAGGALLGGEVATITMSIIGIEAAWPYFAIGARRRWAAGSAGISWSRRPRPRCRSTCSRAGWRS
jgi:hypothetical protein